MRTGDAIDRQAAIDTLDVGAELLRRILNDTDIVGAERAKYEWGLGLIESYISDMEELPSAQPEHATCYLDSPCEYQNINIALPSVQPEKRTQERTETHACDLISRQAAINAVTFGITYAKAIDRATVSVKLEKERM